MGDWIKTKQNATQCSFYSLHGCIKINSIVFSFYPLMKCILRHKNELFICFCPTRDWNENTKNKLFSFSS